MLTNNNQFTNHEKLQFREDINASSERVYDTMPGLSNVETYNQWTSEFNPTSTYEGNREKGAKSYFLGTDEDGKRGGIVSEIADIIPQGFVSIRHYGILDGDNEITDGPMVEKWRGGLENYTFRENKERTSVIVDIDVTDDHLDYFNLTWPRAVNRLKDLAEK
ncbi:MAG TPA: hypothetical protein VKZ54_02275 [Membranihabitans sp.]|nr:hypothetical protein [Membranihabitans sp.]